MSTKRFRIAFSFSGEKRDFVRKMAGLLVAAFGKDFVLFDEHQASQLSAPRATEHLTDLYACADLIVLFVCAGYLESEWCGLELDVVQSLVKKGEQKRVMLCRFDEAVIEQFHGLELYLNLDGQTPQQATRQVLERLALNEELAEDHYVSKCGLDDKSQPTSSLPPLQTTFFGRLEELEKIRSVLSQHSPEKVVMIDGFGGMGKTSLAIRAAEIAAPDFDATIFVTTKAYQMEADGRVDYRYYSIIPTHLAVLKEMALQLGLNYLTDQPEEERLKLILEELKTRRVLIILDNLENLPKPVQERLWTFLDRLPPSCRAIVTSRKRKDRRGFRLINLKALDEQAALALLDDLGRDREALANASLEVRRSLHRQTGGNPLLMHWVVGQLGLGQCLTAESAVRFLRGAPKRNDPLAYIFRDVLNSLDTNETDILAALTHFSHHVTVGLAAEIAKVKPEQAEEALKALAVRGVVLVDKSNIKFILAPMVAEMMRTQQKPRVTHMEGRLFRLAHQLIMDNGGRDPAKFHVLDQNWQLVAASLPLFVEGKNKTLQEICEKLVYFFELRGRWDTFRELMRAAEEKAAEANQHWIAGWRAYQLGYAYFLTHQPDLVLACAVRATHSWENQLGKEKAIPSAIRLEGLAYRLKGDLEQRTLLNGKKSAHYHTAHALLENALEQTEKVAPGSEDEAIMRNSLAELKLKLGDLDAAEKLFRQALDIAKALNITACTAYSKGYLAEIYLARQQWSEAEAWAEKGLKIASKECHKELMGRNSCRLAEALLGQGNCGAGQEYALRAVELFTEIGSSLLAMAQDVLDRCQEKPR